MRYPGFVGPSDDVIARNWNVERTINFYTENKSALALPKTGNILIGTPGLRIWTTLTDPDDGGTFSPIRHLFFQDGRLFALAGNHLVEIYQDGTYTNYGGVGSDNEPGTISSNGTDGGQLLIISAGQGYTFDLTTDTQTEISDPGFPQNNAAMGAFLDGYGLVLARDTDTFYFSALEDFTSWNALDVGQSNFSSDVTRALVVQNREIWMFGSQTTSVWYNTGAATFPFQPISGVFLEQGIVAPFSARPLNGALYWLGGNQDGAGILYRAQGFTPVRISTHAVELQWQRYPTMTDAIAWTYIDDGHSFYLLYFPAGDTTWCFDTTTNQWHERAHWNPRLAQWVPHVGRCHTYAWGTHLIGDRRTGAIYEQRLDLYDEQLVVPL